MVLSGHRNHKGHKLLGTRRRGGGGGGGGEKEIYISLHCHHQNNSCIKMGGDESHVNVSLIVRDKVTNNLYKTVSTDHNQVI